MFLSKISVVQILQSQGSAVFYFITLPMCAVNVLPFLAYLFPLSKIQRRAILATVISIDVALILIAVWLTRQRILTSGYDTWMHLALIRRGVEGGLFTGDPHYLGFPTPPHYSIVDVFHVLLSLISGIAPHVLWASLSPIFAALIFLTYVWWHKELLGDSVLGWLGGLLFMIVVNIEWHYATYPRNVALIFFGLSHLFYFRSVRTKRDKYILYTGICTGLCVMSHLFSGIMCFTSLLAYIFMNWIVELIHRKPRLWKEDLRRLAFIPIGLIVASPWLIVFGKQALTHEEISVSHYSMPSWNLKSTILGWTFTHYRPRLVWNSFPNLLWFPALAGLLICLYYIIRGRYKPQHVFLLSASIVPAIVLLTPLYSPVVDILGEWMPSRFARTIPVYSLTALSAGLVFKFLSAFRADHRKQRIAIRISGTLLGLIFMIIVIPPAVTTQKSLYLSRDQVLTPLYTWDSDFHELKDTLRNKVVLTDPQTSYFLPYYTSAFTVAMPAAHGSPYINHEARLADAAIMFNPKTPSEKREALFDQYKVAYVMLNLRPRLDKAASKYGEIKAYYPSSVKEIFDQQERFRLIYDTNGLYVYAVKPLTE